MGAAASDAAHGDVAQEDVGRALQLHEVPARGAHDLTRGDSGST